MPEPQAQAQAEALHAALLESDARQQAAMERAAQSAREPGEKAGTAVLELKADIAKTQQSIHELKTHVDVLRAETKGQFKLLHWMLGVLIAGVTAILVKLFF